MNALRVRANLRRHRDRGFTLIEVLISLVLSGLIAGVVVSVLLTSLNAADSTTAEINDSNDAALVSSFLIRDGQASGGIDPATAFATAGVSTTDPAGCAQTGALVVRFSWTEHSSATVHTPTVVTYAFNSVAQTLFRQICKDGNPTGTVVLLGSHVTSATATCQRGSSPDATCSRPTAVSLALSGSGKRAPFSTTLTASLRSATSQLMIVNPTTASLPTGEVGLVYPSTRVTTIGATAPTTWSQTGIPAGLTIDNTGLVTGTPTTAGQFTLTATVADKWAATAQRSYAITVSSPLAVVWSAMPNGRVGVSYASTPGSASGGTLPYAWSQTGLPAGLALDPASGTVSGNPTTGGMFPVTINVTDASGASAQKPYNITIVGRARYSDAVLATPGLGYYWRLGDTPPSTALTNTFGGINGLYVDGPTLGVAGALASDPNTAVQFDGVNDYATTPPTIFDNVSIEFWFKSTQGVGTSVLWNDGAGMITTDINPAKDFGISLRSDGYLVAGVGTNGSADSVLSSNGGYNNGNWHYVVFTRVKSGGAMQLYVDAVLVASASSTSGNPGNGAIPFAFGRIQNPPGHYFAGTLDEVAVYSQVLPQATITSHYNAGL